MNQPEARLLELYQRYIDGIATEEERRQLMQFIGQEEMAPAIHRLIDNSYDNDPVSQEMSAERSDQLFRAILQAAEPVRTIAPVHRVHFMRRWWAAAAILLLLATAAYWYVRNNKQEVEIVQVPEVKMPDILPGKDGAVLTLADGTKVVLDSLGNGLVAAENGAKVMLQNGELKYDPIRGQSKAISYNTMTTPKGRQFKLVLPDQTQVWLNAASSIRYPTVFSGNERKVEVTGEVYFEVAHNARLPFRVLIPPTGKTKGGLVEVLGTHFNINAYDDEESIMTTLLEGSVKVSAPGPQSPVILSPGQQSVISSKSNEFPRIQVQTADVQQAIAWKNGVFSFTNASLPTVMRQLARWYDVEVEYQGPIPDGQFDGKIGNTLTLDQVLKGLAKTRINYKIENKNRIIIMP